MINAHNLYLCGPTIVLLIGAGGFFCVCTYTSRLQYEGQVIMLCLFFAIQNVCFSFSVSQWIAKDTSIHDCVGDKGRRIYLCQTILTTKMLTGKLWSNTSKTYHHKDISNCI